MLKGQCLCQAVRFEVEDAFLYAAYCHCSRCRRRSGSAFTAFGGIELDKLSVREGAEHVLRNEVSAFGYNAFCARCLSRLYAVVNNHQRVHVQLGSLIDLPSRKPDHHIQVASKAPWHDITDDLPQYAEFPPG
jgi:hypothetical protein